MSLISGAALVAGVVGRPISHSLSPVLHGAWIAATGLDAVYVPFGPDHEAGFDALIEVGRAGALRGLNVTAPFKTRALDLADTSSDTARACGSANLLTFSRGRVHADSTDGQGLIGALDEQAPDVNWVESPIVVLGSGGAGRAAVVALLAAGARQVRLANRTRARAEAVAERLGAEVEARDLADPGLDGTVRLVINALGASPDIDLTVLRPGAAVMDMTYRPLETLLLADARRHGLMPVDGLAMLIAQARPSFEALFGVAPPAIDVRALALARLERLA